MTTKIHTIQSSNKKEFDKQVNQFLELGGEIIDGGYQVINNDDGIVYSQVIVFNNFEIKIDDDNGKIESLCPLNEDGKKDGIDIWFNWRGQKEVESIYKDGVLNGICTSWHGNGEKMCKEIYKDGKKDGLSTWWYGNGQKRTETIWRDGKVISSKQWNEDGSPEEFLDYLDIY